MKLDTKGLLWIKLFRKLRLTVTEWLKYPFPVNSLLLTRAEHAQDSSSSKGTVTRPLRAGATEYQHNFPRFICRIGITNGTNSSVFSASQKARGIVFAGSLQEVGSPAVGRFTRGLLWALPNQPTQHHALQAPPLLQAPLLLSQC